MLASPETQAGLVERVQHLLCGKIALKEADSIYFLLAGQGDGSSKAKAQSVASSLELPFLMELWKLSKYK